MFVSINYLTFSPELAETVSSQFDTVKRNLAEVEGFQRFRLLRPLADGKPWLVYSEWDSADLYEAWKTSTQYDKMHAHRGADSAGHGGHLGAGHPGAGPSGDPGAAHGVGAGASHGGAIAMHSEVVTYSVESDLAE